jgi:hypothetical protein
MQDMCAHKDQTADRRQAAKGRRSLTGEFKREAAVLSRNLSIEPHKEKAPSKKRSFTSDT